MLSAAFGAYALIMRFKWNRANSSVRDRLAASVNTYSWKRKLPTQATGFSAITPSIDSSFAAAMIAEDPPTDVPSTTTFQHHS